MKHYFKLIQLGLFIVTTVSCAQARKSYRAGADVLWTAQELCSNEDGGNIYGCFQLQLNITGNFAYLDVLELGVDSTYRVMARRFGDSQFHVLADNISTSAGGTVILNAKATHDIRDYEEYLIETEIKFGTYGGTINAAPGDGITMVRQHVHFPELQIKSSTGANYSSTNNRKSNSLYR